ncbi:hexosaminidase D-like isoform X2 [Anticarsia gemmatalis]
MHKIVHLDLKGAPLRVPYLKQVLLKAKSWGATGFLIEWEDTFPYYAQLSELGSNQDANGEGMYSMPEVLQIFQFARENGLEAIQLVQTIGHLEFVLKHPSFRGLREVASSPAVLCPSKEASFELVMTMLDQALEVQPDARFFHIGADEVWHKGECPDCKRRAANSPFGTDSLFLEYIQNLTLYLKKKRPDLTILMWDDMLRHVNVEAFKTYDLSNIQLVYWDYNTKENFHLNYMLWQRYSQFFRKIWAGTAFKGANGSSKILAPVARYVSNHDAWLQEIKVMKESIDFMGIILTGWSRYDHFATLCELMPVMLPSLASCLRVVTQSEHVPRDQLVKEVLPSEEWAGEELARCVHSFLQLRERCFALLNGEQVATWLNPWQRERKYTVCTHIQAIENTARILRQELETLQSNISAHLLSITGKRSTDEWLRTNMSPILNKVIELHDAAHDAMSRDAAVKP